VTVECDRGELLRKLRVELADLELQLEAHQSGDMRFVEIGMRVREIMGIVTRLETDRDGPNVAYAGRPLNARLSRPTKARLSRRCHNPRLQGSGLGLSRLSTGSNTDTVVTPPPIRTCRGTIR